MAKGITDKLGNEIDLNDLILIDKESVSSLFGHVIAVDRASNLLLRGNKGGKDMVQSAPGRIKVLIEIDVPYLIQENGEHRIGNVTKVVNPNPEHKPANISKGPALVS